MKIDELMVGDWVFHPSIIPSSNKPLQILEILVDRVRLIDGANRGSAFLENLEYIQPIPLTSDIFEKNGFEEFYGGGFIIKELSDDEIPSLYVWNGTDSLYAVDNYSLNKYTFIKECKYVHEFQHELKSCGVEKEIVL